MAGEKNFENRLKKWLEDEGIYPLGEPVNRMSAPPCGYWEKRWGGGRYVKSGLQFLHSKSFLHPYPSNILIRL